MGKCARKLQRRRRLHGHLVETEETKREPKKEWRLRPRWPYGGERNPWKS